MRLRTKKCVGCGKLKPLRAYSKRPNTNGTKTIYHKSHCKQCCSGLSSKWRLDNLTRFRKYQNAYHKARLLAERAEKALLKKSIKVFKKGFTQEKKFRQRK